MTPTKTVQDTHSLKDKVASLIKEVNTTHRYSMSHIYGLYNEVFATAEIPQSCASCLIRKVNLLKAWLADHSNKEKITSAEVLQTSSKKRKEQNKTI